MMTSCVVGLGCIAASFVMPEAFSLAPLDATECASHWRVAGPLRGLAVPPEVGPPIRSI
jgi:hypothetical protein